MNKDKISVILSTFNSANTIEKAIKSILEQTYENFELLICDDYSNDMTSDIINEYQKSDFRVKSIKNNQNLGLTKSLNKLIDLSIGNMICRHDADDFSNKFRFEKQVTFIKNNFDVVVSRAIKIEDNNLIPGLSYYFPSRLITKFKNPFIHGTLMIKKEVILKIGKYNENFYYAQDYKLFSDLIKNKFRIKKIFEPLYHLNTKNNISSNYYKEQKYYSDCVKNGLIP